MAAVDNIQTLNLSAMEVKSLTGWPDAMIEDYLTILRNLLELASIADTGAAQIDQNTLDIAANALNIAANATNIATNATNISTNSTNISTNSTNLSNHISNDSAHGVTGDNVGDEDFAQTAVGGVVLLADLVADVSDSTEAVASADIAAAPVAYDQAYTDTVATLVNELKAVVNAFITNDYNGESVDQFNLLLQEMKDAKQLNTV